MLVVAASGACQAVVMRTSQLLSAGQMWHLVREKSVTGRTTQVVAECRSDVAFGVGIVDHWSSNAGGYCFRCMFYAVLSVHEKMIGQSRWLLKPVLLYVNFIITNVVIIN